jgi:hypothetical protein
LIFAASLAFEIIFLGDQVVGWVNLEAYINSGDAICPTPLFLAAECLPARLAALAVTAEVKKSLAALVPGTGIEPV